MKITAEEIKQLRAITQAGVMDCKKALLETGGNMQEAIKLLREKGLAEATKKSVRAATEGVISAYVHSGNKIGVLLELNCETDFVARTPEFLALAKDICMQIAASEPLYISRDDISPEVIEAEKEIYRNQALKAGKPEKVIEKIVNGKLEKFFSQVCLLEQPFIKDTDITVSDLIKQNIAKFGENIVIRKFVRYQLGEKS